MRRSCVGRGQGVNREIVDAYGFVVGEVLGCDAVYGGVGPSYTWRAPQVVCRLAYYSAKIVIGCQLY